MYGMMEKSLLSPFLALSDKEICLLTGDIDAASREELWLRSSVVVCTPQVAWNDLRREISDRARNGESKLFSIIPYITAAIRIDYAAEYLESQGYLIFYNHFSCMSSSRPAPALYRPDIRGDGLVEYYHVGRRYVKNKIQKSEQYLHFWSEMRRKPVLQRNIEGGEDKELHKSKNCKSCQNTA